MADFIQNKNVIRNQSIEDNAWIHVTGDVSELAVNDLPAGDISVPLAYWQTNKDALLARDADVAVQIVADDEVIALLDDISELSTVVFPFASYVDGRSYSHAYLLRTRLGFEGEVRAIGDVHFDQLDFLSRCGFDAFELPEGDNLEAALTAFSEFSVVYQPSADDGRLIFSKRRTVH